MTTHPRTDGDGPAGSFTTLDGEDYYRISGVQALPPFLTTLASDTDLWLFVSSRGGLTAGRVDPDGCLFPYETVDKLHDGHHHTGPVTLLRVQRPGGAEVLWHPLGAWAPGGEPGERNLYKNSIGNRLVFEEVQAALGLACRYRWAMSDEYGLVRTVTLENRSAQPVRVRVLDGLRNVMPYGVPLALQQQSSCLVDAYKQADCDPETGLGIFALTAEIVDRAEPAEELRANTVWCCGLEDVTVSLSLEALAAFERGEPVAFTPTLSGRRGNYLAAAVLELGPGEQARWHLVADVGQSHVQVAARRRALLGREDLGAAVEASLQRASAGLLRLVASADGLQRTRHTEAAVHHFANVLFNNMRGGVAARNYDLPAADFAAFLARRNAVVAARQEALVSSLPETLATTDLQSRAHASQDADLRRLVHEYLPLHFGRRHGDPSRPWNRFAIHVRNPDGSRALRYEGNWRDIFQNWEALGTSFPGLLPHFIAKFVNASTVDGFNPYRITSDGVDWEVVDPDDPWSYIGYWGDHQIVYLLRLLAAVSRTTPGWLDGMLDQEIFSYTEVPYRLQPYAEIVAHPRSTIHYDSEAAARIAARVRELGADGKLVLDRQGAVYHVSLLEKLLVPALSKLSNFVPQAGIWMNTQRPEWNDANNALAGHGVSMVTLCHLRRYVAFLETLLAGRAEARVLVSTEVVRWLQRVRAILAEARALLEARPLGGAEQRRFLDALGESFSAYRGAVYEHGFTGKSPLRVAEVLALCREARGCLEHAIRANRRPDGLYHAYNLLGIDPARHDLEVHSLYEMLEGQVAALCSGLVSAAEASELLPALFTSRLYRPDQKSFLLYPARELPGFLAKNVVPEPRVAAVPLLQALLAAGDTSVVARDAFGVCRFHADFRNALDLEAALDRLAERPEWTQAVPRDRRAVHDVFEAVFDHRAFTGRSGTMYGYEGLGSVYWHMVAKLLLAVQEIAVQAARDGEPAPIVRSLIEGYYRIRAGLGFEKSVTEFGAFPTDPYSHTPAGGPAQQPGMTGQVKEEILTRFGELGVEVEAGTVRFRPRLLRRDEFVRTPSRFEFYDVAGEAQSLDLPAGALAFTFCQVPVVYQATEGEAWIQVAHGTRREAKLPGDELGPEASRALFERRGTITRIEVAVPAHLLWPPEPRRQAPQEKPKKTGIVTTSGRTGGPRT